MIRLPRLFCFVFKFTNGQLFALESIVVAQRGLCGSTGCTVPHSRRSAPGASVRSMPSPVNMTGLSANRVLNSSSSIVPHSTTSMLHRKRAAVRSALAAVASGGSSRASAASSETSLAPVTLASPHLHPLALLRASQQKKHGSSRVVGGGGVRSVPLMPVVCARQWQTEQSWYTARRHMCCH